MKKNSSIEVITSWMGVIGFGLILVFFVYHSYKYLEMLFSNEDSASFVDPRGVVFVQVALVIATVFPVLGALLSQRGKDVRPPATKEE